MLGGYFARYARKQSSKRNLKALPRTARAAQLALACAAQLALACAARQASREGRIKPFTASAALMACGICGGSAEGRGQL